jgi:hypothetical protein
MLFASTVNYSVYLIVIVWLVGFYLYFFLKKRSINLISHSFGRGNFLMTNTLLAKVVNTVPWELFRYCLFYIVILFYFIFPLYFSLLLFYILNRLAVFDVPSLDFQSMPFETRYGALLENISSGHPFIVSSPFYLFF